MSKFPNENKIGAVETEKIRNDFPILSANINEKPLVYFDNAATTQKPKVVLEAIRNYYEKVNANPHRGAHQLSVLSTELYEKAREKVKEFIHANSSKEIIFTKNTTEALNLLAYSYGMNFIREGDEIVLSIAEHHSNLLPWQQVAKAKGAVLKFMYVNEEGQIPLSEIQEKITDKTKLVSVAHVSNALGTIHPVKEIIAQAHKVGAIIIIDGAQSTPHFKVDMVELNADFFVFSGHKMLGPMGVGVLYGKEQLLEQMPPFLLGGSMIEYVQEQEATFAQLPFKFEAGTQNVEGAIGLAAAIEYLQDLGMEVIEDKETELMTYALEKMSNIPYVTVYGPHSVKDRGGIISFTIEGVHPHDVSSIVDTYGIALRAGHHCAQPLLKYLNLNATSRISFYFYNTKEEIDRFIEAIQNVRKWLGYESE